MAQISKTCPRCGSSISFEERAMHATCGSCDVSFKVSELMNPGASAGENAAAEMAAMFASFESPESGLIYLESVFANIDWDAYAKYPTVIIDKAQQMIEKNNIKAGAVATTWYLDFLCLATPLIKKFEGLEKVATEMGAKYNPFDNTTILGDFDSYKAVIKHLIFNKDKFTRRIENDINFATKLNLEDAKLQEMKEKAAIIKKFYDAIPEEEKAVEDIDLKTIPAVATELAKTDEKLVAEYSKKGIDAKQTYKEAVQYYNSINPNKNGALALFESIRNYKDSADYIKKINKYFNFNGEFYQFLEKNFIFKLNQATPEENAEGMNPKAKDKNSAKKGCGSKKAAANTEEEYTGDTYELFEIIDDVPAAEPIIKKITQIITVYANKLFYIKNGKTIACYDFGAQNETEICSSKKDGVQLYTYFLNNSKSKMYLTSNIEEAKLGCFASYIAKIKDFFAKLFKKQAKAPKVVNSIALKEINLTNNSYTSVIDAATKIYGLQGDYIFYSVAEDFDENDLFEKTSLRSYNTVTGEKKVVLDDVYDIHQVIDGKVCYTITTPNGYNRELRIHDIDKETDTLIEENVYKFKLIAGDRVFYTIGNDNFQPLYSNNFEGNDRLEVMANVERIVKVVNNWIYVEKYSSYYNTNVIVKVSLDGKERITLCANFKISVMITDNFFYYLDRDNNLCVVQGNGNGYRLIAEDIERKNIIIDNKRNKIYYLRYEKVARGAKNYSLYAMDIEGHGVKKVIFNVTAMKQDENDKDSIYIKRNERCAFVLDKPGEAKKKKKGDPEGPEITILDLTRFYKLDLDTLVPELIITIGMPDASYAAKAGCGKTKEEKVKFIQLPRIPNNIENEVEFEEEDAYIVKNDEEEESNAPANGCNVGGKQLNLPAKANGCGKAGSGCAKK